MTREVQQIQNITYMIVVLSVTFLACLNEATEDAVYRKLEEMCFAKREHYIKEGALKCNVSFTGACWPETTAGASVVMRCPFLKFSSKNMMSRICNKNGLWEQINTTRCMRYVDVKSGNSDKQVGSNTTTMPAIRTTQDSHQQKLGSALVWLVFVLVIIAIVLILYLVPLVNERFNIHKNLLAAFVLHFCVFLVNYHAGLSTSTQVNACKAVWIFLRFFIGAEVMWLLNETIFHLLQLKYSSSEESYYSLYLLFGWGVPGIITVCGFIPLIEFTVGSSDRRCWHSIENTLYMLILHVPLTLMIAVNVGLVFYVIYILWRKTKERKDISAYDILARRSARIITVVMPVLAVSYLIIFYPLRDDVGYNYLLSVLPPLQGLLVCLFFVFFDSEAQSFFKRRWRRRQGGYNEQEIPTDRTTSTSSSTQDSPSGRESQAQSGRVEPGAMRVTVTPNMESPIAQGSTSSLSRLRTPRVQPDSPRPLKIEVSGSPKRVFYRLPDGTVRSAMAWRGASIKDRPDRSRLRTPDTTMNAARKNSDLRRQIIARRSGRRTKSTIDEVQHSTQSLRTAEELEHAAYKRLLRMAEERNQPPREQLRHSIPSEAKTHHRITNVDNNRAIVSKEVPYCTAWEQNEDTQHDAFYKEDETAPKGSENDSGPSEFNALDTRNTDCSFLSSSPEPEAENKSVESDGWSKMSEYELQGRLSDDSNSSRFAASPHVSTSGNDTTDREDPTDRREETSTAPKSTRKTGSKAKAGGTGGWRKVREVTQKRLKARRKGSDGNRQEGPKQHDPIPMPSKHSEAIKKAELYRSHWINMILQEKPQEEDEKGTEAKEKRSPLEMELETQKEKKPPQKKK